MHLFTQFKWLMFVWKTQYNNQNVPIVLFLFRLDKWKKLLRYDWLAVNTNWEMFERGKTNEKETLMWFRYRQAVVDNLIKETFEEK